MTLRKLKVDRKVHEKTSGHGIRGIYASRHRSMGSVETMTDAQWMFAYVAHWIMGRKFYPWYLSKIEAHEEIDLARLFQTKINLLHGQLMM